LYFIVVLIHSYKKGAIEKSARAAGLPIGVAEKYAADLARRYPGNTCISIHLGAAPLT